MRSLVSRPYRGGQKMSTHDLYALPAELSAWEVPMSGNARLNWEYGEPRGQLLTLYQKGKDKQWDGATRIDWDLDVDPENPLSVAREIMPLYGSSVYAKLDDAGIAELLRHQVAWQFSNFLHGEQAAMICSARIVESVPDIDAKFYAATQTMDEARHAEIYARFLQEKLELYYPINQCLKSLLDDVLSDSRWDIPYLGMQVLIEGLALAAFGLLRDLTGAALPKQILTYVMQDEARHVAFGRIALRDYYKQISDRERTEREEFVLEGCRLLKGRFIGEEVWGTLGFDVDACREHVNNSENLRYFNGLLFARVVPCIRDIGLWSPRVRDGLTQLGVINMADSDLVALMRQDEDLAERLDAERFAAQESQRRAEVASVIDDAVDGQP